MDAINPENRHRLTPPPIPIPTSSAGLENFTATPSEAEAVRAGFMAGWAHGKAYALGRLSNIVDNVDDETSNTWVQARCIGFDEDEGWPPDQTRLSVAVALAEKHAKSWENGNRDFVKRPVYYTLPEQVPE